MDPPRKRRKTLGVRLSMSRQIVIKVVPVFEESSEHEESKSTTNQRGYHKTKAGDENLPFKKSSDQAESGPVVQEVESSPLESNAELDEKNNVWDDHSVDEILQSYSEEPELAELDVSQSIIRYDDRMIQEILNRYDEPESNQRRNLRDFPKPAPTSTKKTIEKKPIYVNEKSESSDDETQFQFPPLPTRPVKNKRDNEKHEEGISSDDETQFEIPDRLPLSTDFIPNQRKNQHQESNESNEIRVYPQPNKQNKKFFEMLKPEVRKKLSGIHPSMHYPTMKEYQEKNNELAKLYQMNWVKRSCAICAHIGKAIDGFPNDPFHQFLTERSFEGHWKKKHFTMSQCEICQEKCNDSRALKGHRERMKTNPNLLHYKYQQQVLGISNSNE